MILDPPSVWQIFLADVVGGFKDISTVVAAASVPDSSFYAQYNILATASPQARKRIFEDSRIAILVTAVESNTDYEGAGSNNGSLVADWVRKLKMLALSAAFLDGTPYEVDRVSFPSGRTFLVGAKRYLQLGRDFDFASLSLDVNGNFRVDGALIELAPVPEAGGLELVTSDPLLYPPNVADLVPLTEVQVDTADWINVIDEAVKLVSLHTASLELVRCFARAIVPVQGTAENVHCSISFSTKPGALYLSYASSPEVIAEAIVHESDHQWFYALTRHHSFWTQPIATQPEIFRSPWRDDPRPLDGLLRGASAFVRVAEFWSGLVGSKKKGDVDLSSAGQKAILSALQAIDALRSIIRFGELSDTGYELVDDLDLRAKQLLNGLERYSQFPAWEASALRKMAQHDEAWRMRNNATEKDRVTL